MTEPRTRVAAALATILGLIASGFTAHMAPQADGSWHGITGAPSLIRVALALLAGLCVWLLGRVADTRPFLIMSACLLPLIPAATGLGSGLLFFSGFTSLLLFAVLIGWSARDVVSRFPELGARSVFLIALAFFLFVGRFVPGAAGPQGDEPHYLLIAESLLEDGDVDLKNQFDEQAFSKFTSGKLEPHTAPRTPKGTLYSIHTPGLSALVAPGYAVGGFIGARAVLSIVMAGVVSLLYTAARAWFDSSTAMFVFFAATFATPLPIYANSLFPDSAAVLPVAATLAWFAVPRTGLFALACASIATLPWLHPRFLPLGVLLALGLAVKDGLSGRRAFAALSPLLGSLALLLAHFHSIFGSVSLSAAYGPNFSSDVSLLRVPWGGSALLMDRQFGLFLFAPLLLFGIFGMRSLARRSPFVTTVAVAVTAVFLGVGGAFSMWWGGASAPARFLIGATPALLMMAAALWHGTDARSAQRAMLGAATGFGVGVVTLACLAPRALHNRADGESGLLRLLAPTLDIDRFFPSFVTETGVWLALAWGLVLTAMMLKPRIGLWLAPLPIAWVALTASRPLLDPFASSLRVLEAWDDHRVTLGGADASDAFHLDVPLGAPSWELSPGKQVYSPRFSLPAGEWTLRVESRSETSPDALNLARLSVISDDSGEVRVASLLIQAAEPVATVAFVLPNDERRLRLLAEGVQSTPSILSVRLVPRSLQR